MDGFMPTARRNGYPGRFLVIAEAADARNSASVIRLGAAGIFLKSEAPERLFQAIALVANGAVWLDQKIIRLLADRTVDRPEQPDSRSASAALTERDRKVLDGILGGHTNRKIALDLGLSEGRVKGAVERLFRRTGSRTRSQFVRAVLEGSLGTSLGLTKGSRTAAAAQAPSVPARFQPVITGSLSIRR
jgi:DNA-binding NarL/FixJ family response regulator